MSMLEHALQYAARGWRVFRLTGYKTPFKGSHGFKDGTVDAEVIERWWGPSGRRITNIGLATGTAKGSSTNVVVFDADGPDGLASLRQGCEAHGGIPRTLAARTSKGWHFFFEPPAGVTIKKVTSRRAASGDDGLDIAGEGSYVVLPPSVNAKTGFVYQWANNEPIAVMPVWLVEFCRMHRLAQKKGPPPASLARGTQSSDSFQNVKIGGVLHDMPPGQAPTLHSFSCPESIGADSRKSRLADRALAVERQGELGEFLEALRRLSAGCGYDQWFELGAAIYDFDSSESGLMIFKAWSRSVDGYDTPEAQESCDKKWIEYAIPKPGVRLITKATIYALANQAIALERKQDSRSPAAGHGSVNGAHALPSIFTAPAGGSVKDPIFIDLDKEDNPKSTCTNTGIAIAALGVDCRKDCFHEAMLVEGHSVNAWAGPLSDDVVLMLRKIIKAAYGFDPGRNHALDATVQLCLEHQFNPVVEYLDGLVWDGHGRIERWVVDYLGAPDTPLNREFGRLMLIAAVRRARKPGTKFDQIVVFEGVEGTGKSTAVKILAGEDNFSDQNILAASDKEQQEAFRGVWLHEIAELAGMKRTEVERVKQFASRTEDRARPAYGRVRVDMKRRGIFVATTNEETYLKSETGNRRFWPVRTGAIDLVRLAADRDQLWAEAARAEANGASIELPTAIRVVAAKEQEDRLDADPWREGVIQFLNGQCKDGKVVVSAYTVLEIGLRIGVSNINQAAHNRTARILKKLGLTRKQFPDETGRPWKYHSECWFAPVKAQND